MIEQAFRIGSFANIPVRIHWTFLLLIAYVVGTGLYEKLDWTGIGMLVAFTLCMFVCVVLHEFGHALTAKRFGVKTADIILLPIGGVARLVNLPDKPKHELWIAIMGPVVNLIIAIIIFITLYIMHGSDLVYLVQQELDLHMNLSQFLILILQANIILMIFNLIPAFPMDGGRVLRAFIAMYSNRLIATKWASRIGQICCIIFIIVGIFTNAWTLAFIGVFIFLGASQEYNQVQHEFKYKNKIIKDYYRKINQYFPEYSIVKEVKDELRLSGLKHFPVVDLQGRISGFISLSNIYKNYDKVMNNTLREIMNPHVIVLQETSTVLQAISYLESGLPAVLVSDGYQIIGILDKDCINNNIV